MKQCLSMVISVFVMAFGGQLATFGAENNSLLVTDDGNIGIGTSSPSESLTIFNKTSDPYIKIGYDDSWSWKIGRNSTDAGKSYFINNHGASDETEFVISTNGFVGIVTDSPEKRVHVKDATALFDTGFGGSSVNYTYGSRAYFIQVVHVML